MWVGIGDFLEVKVEREGEHWKILVIVKVARRGPFCVKIFGEEWRE